jgi:hypothetical protein
MEYNHERAVADGCNSSMTRSFPLFWMSLIDKRRPIQLTSQSKYSAMEGYCALISGPLQDAKECSSA